MAVLVKATLDGSHSLVSLPRGGVLKAKLAKLGCRPISLRPCLYYANNEALQQLLNLFAAGAGQDFFLFFFLIEQISTKIRCYVEPAFYLERYCLQLCF